MRVLNDNEIQSPRKRKGIIDFDRLMGLLGFENYDDLKNAMCFPSECENCVDMKKSDVRKFI